MLAINTNTSSLFSSAALEKNKTTLDSASERLASAQRINSAKDDSAGLAIALQYAAQLAGSEQGYRNLNDAVSVAQVGDSGAGQLGESLQRMRELAVQSANGTLSASDRSALQKEVSELQKQVSSIIGDSRFGGVSPLAQSGSVRFQAGAAAGDGIDVTTVDAASDLSGLGVDTIDISNTAGAAAALGVIDGALGYIGDIRARFGASLNQLEASQSRIQHSNVDTAAARSRLLDADYARETAERTRSLIQEQSATAMLGQANAMPNMVARLLG